jgi:tRNA U34 5-methylaminomethyl-2-thiouridine-forming methyltransferase MnmC
MIYTHVAAGLLGATIAFLAAWQAQDWRYNAHIAQMQQAHEASLRKSAEAARAQEQALSAAKQKAEEAYALEKRKAAVAARNARAELDGLRNELYAIPAPVASANPATTARVNGVTIERQLLGECATALVEMAAGSDLLAAQLVGLQGYVRNVCVAPK